jgi:GH24 family phage-related lysozyme (muramidase)
LKNALLWSLSQQPAFRKAAQDMDDDILGMFEQEKNPQSSPEMPSLPEVSMEEEEEEINRSPAASEFLKEKETTSLTGYVPKKSSKSGVTIATGLDLANFDIEKLDISEELKTKLRPFVGLRGKSAEQVASNLKITKEEQESIDSALESHVDSKTSKLTKGLDAEMLTDEFKEGLDSFYTNSPSGARAFVGRVKEGNIDEAIDKGVEWNKTGGKFAAGLLQRRMEELNKMFPEKNELIQKEGKIEYDKYKNRTKRSWEEINTIKKDLDRVIKMKSSGNDIPEFQIEKVFEGINQMDIPESDKLALQDEVVLMETYSDSERLKKLLEKYNNMS